MQAHLLICFIALVMWRTLETWLQSKGLGELYNLRSMDVVTPLHGGRQARLRMVGNPERLCAELLKKMALKLPVRPKIVQNVVEENAPC